MVLLLVVVALLALPATAQANGRYVALGDSIAAMVDPPSYVPRFAGSLGITDVRNVAVSGETSTGILAGQLTAALGLINDRTTDTRVVTVDIGGNDWFSGRCGPWNRPPCPFADNLASLLGQLRAALDSDPGDERLLVMAYYNPASGLGTQRERDLDAGLFGTDARIDSSAHGDAWGMTDVIGWEACRFGGTLVDAWPAFKTGGQALILDGVHPSSAGQELLAELFADPSKGTPTPACPATTPFAKTYPFGADGVARGLVEPRLAPAWWWFEYGPTTAYGSGTQAGQLPASAGTREVVAGLPPGTCHSRLVVENDHGRFAGRDQQAAGVSCDTSPVADTTPPTVVLSGNTTQKLDRTISVLVSCPTEACTVTADGSLSVPAAASTFKLAGISKQIEKGVHARLALKVPRAARTAAARALRRHHKVKATIKISVHDHAGNATTRLCVVRLTW